MPGARNTSRSMWGRTGGVVLLFLLLSACAASRSEVAGAFARNPERNLGAEKVSAFFLFRHLSQQHGFDAIPKLNAYGVKDFDNIFRDALAEISNVDRYETFTELPTDVNAPERRQKLEASRQGHDYTLEIRFFEESSFRQQFFSGTVSLLSLTVVPMPYSWDYTISVELRDKEGRPVGAYRRQATLSNWVQLMLLFAYPFHPLEGKREEIYAESLRDIFRQIEAEKVLR